MVAPPMLSGSASLLAIALLDDLEAGDSPVGADELEGLEALQFQSSMATGRNRALTAWVFIRLNFIFAPDFAGYGCACPTR